MKFFVLGSPKAGRGEAVTDFVPVDGASSGEAPRCTVCGKYVGMRPLLPPVRVELEGWGEFWGDVAFGPADQVLVSDRLKNAVADAGLNGFAHIDPLVVAKVKRRRPSISGSPPEYWLATVARSGAMLDGSASGLERDDGAVCPECGLGGVIKRLRRVVLRPGTWTGEDVFFARGLPGTILVSERFKSLCEPAGIANCVLVEAETFGFDHYPQELSAGGARAH
jgi:hypothetical protein